MDGRSECSREEPARAVVDEYAVGQHVAPDQRVDTLDGKLRRHDGDGGKRERNVMRSSTRDDQADVVLFGQMSRWTRGGRVNGDGPGRREFELGENGRIHAGTACPRVDQRPRADP